MAARTRCGRAWNPTSPCSACGAGVEPDHRKYHPHVTLARTNRSSGSLEPFLARTAGLRLGPWEVDAYLLYESFLRPEGSVYEPVMRYALEPE